MVINGIPETAISVIDACEAKAKEIENPMDITVANSGGNHVTHDRIGGAWLASDDISRNKAFITAVLGMPTPALAEPSNPGNSLYGLQNTNQGRRGIFGRGNPLVENRDAMGVVGVSGGPSNRTWKSRKPASRHSRNNRRSSRVRPMHLNLEGTQCQ